MPQFNYRGRYITGEEVEGVLQAASSSAASEQLLQKKIIPLEIKTTSSTFFTQIHRSISSQVSQDELQTFTRQMYTLLHSGLPIMLAIQGIAQTTPSAPFKIILDDIHHELIKGQTLSRALYNHPKVFDTLFISIIHMGENTGQLDEVFLTLSHYLKRQSEVQREIKSATRYPVFVLSIIVLSFIGMNIWITPKFAQFFMSLGVELPLVTQALIQMSSFINTFYPFITGTLVGLVSLFYYVVRQPKGLYLFDQYKIRLPILGSVYKRALLARFSRCLATMLNAGLIITEALSLASDLVDNTYIQSKLVAMRKQLEGGITLTQSAHESGIFTPMILQMIAVGEESGSLASLLDEVADFYERELDFELKQLTSRLEPVLIIAMSILVAFLALGIYLPMWDMMDAVL